MIDKKIDEKDLLEVKKMYDHHLDKGSEIMKNTQFKVEDISGVIIGKNKMSQDQINKP